MIFFNSRFQKGSYIFIKLEPENFFKKLKIRVNFCYLSKIIVDEG